MSKLSEKMILQFKGFFITSLFIIVLGLFFGVLILRRKTEVSQTHKISIVTSFYPLYFFTHEIVKDYATVTNLTPAGAEPHDYEPSTQDVVRLERSKLLIINGSGLEPWSGKLRPNLESKQIKIIETSAGLATQQIEEEGKKIQDPHIWLDPRLAKEEVVKIAQELIEVDPTNTSTYRVNSENLQKKFDLLDQEFRSGLAQCKQKSIVTSHAAFGYVASRYGLKQIPITGLTPDEEPSPQKLAEIAKFAKENGIKYIFFETLVSPKLAETIASEIGAQTLFFDPLEGLTKEEEMAGQDYFSIQRENLKNLKIALECN